MAQGGRLTRHLDDNAIRKVLHRIYNQEHSLLWRLTHKKNPDKQKGGAANE